MKSCEDDIIFIFDVLSFIRLNITVTSPLALLHKPSPLFLIPAHPISGYPPKNVLSLTSHAVSIKKFYLCVMYVSSYLCVMFLICVYVVSYGAKVVSG